MDTLELCRLLTRRCARRNITFYGVFAIDQLQREAAEMIQRDNSQRDACLIVNTHPINKEGEHWLAVYFYQRRSPLTFMYSVSFDSFGFPLHLMNASLCKFIQHHSYNSTYNTYLIQPLDSTTCGQFCVFFILVLRDYNYDIDALIKGEFRMSMLDFNASKVKKFVKALTFKL